MIIINKSRAKRILFRPVEEKRVILNALSNLKLTKISFQKFRLVLQASKLNKHFIACIKEGKNTKKNKNI